MEIGTKRLISCNASVCWRVLEVNALLCKLMYTVYTGGVKAAIKHVYISVSIAER